MTQNNLKILLVDDVDFFRDVMCDYFKRTPATIIMASDGEEAINVAMREWPGLIYMDVGMPGMNGIEVCKKIKAHPQLKKIPVLLVFTPDRDATIKEVEASGCDGYLAKPFGREEFLNLGHRHLFNIQRRERRVPCQMTIDFEINGASYQGRGVGRALAKAVIGEARKLGYQKMRLDTIESMKAAQWLYFSLGFKTIEAYCHNPLDNPSFMELAL